MYYDLVLGEIRLFPWSFAPAGWALCNGQLLPVSQNLQLFSLIGIRYGGNGVTNFALPDLQGRVPLHFGKSNGIGQRGGLETHNLRTNEMPNHSHQVTGSTVSPPTEISPANAYWTKGTNQYSKAALATSGHSWPHNNMQPYLVLSHCIAIEGSIPES